MLRHAITVRQDTILSFLQAIPTWKIRRQLKFAVRYFEEKLDDDSRIRIMYYVRELIKRKR